MTIAASVTPRPEPPSSTGIAAPSQPASAMAATNSSGKRPVSSVLRQYSASNLAQSFSTASRIACCSSVNQKPFMPRTSADRTPPHRGRRHAP